MRVAAAPDPAGASGAGCELTLALRPRFEPLLRQRIAGLAERTPAELSAANMWLFRQVHRWRWHDGPWPCISGLGYDGQPQAIPLFDVRDAPARVLHALLERHGCLSPLTEREADAIDRGCFALACNRDDADYLYPVAQFRHYRGALHKKRNLVAQLQSSHAIGVEPYGPDLQEEALAVLGGWMREKGKQAGEADDAPCREALALAPQIGLQGFLVRADGEAAGFLLAEELQRGVWVVRFSKGLARFKGIAQFMFHHFAADTARAVEWLNFEQDLGLPNFRQTKLSYRPAALLPKWRLLPLAAGTTAS